MQRLKGFSRISDYRGGMLSIGNFDGVHRGHQQILETLVNEAHKASVPAVVMTFEPHPLQLLSPQNFPPRLTTAAKKAELFAQSGVDAVIEYPTDQSFLDLLPEEFFRSVILEQLDARGLVEGPNFYFGKDRKGTIEILRSLTASAGRSLTVVTPLEIDGQTVSSSLIRKLIAAGEVHEAGRLLGRPYELSGTVSRGAGRGRTLGFPTANLTDIETLIPGDGVYAAWCRLGDRDVMAAVNIGGNPTFAETERKVEAHLLDDSSDLYGSTLSLEFVDRIRPARAFASVEELQQQVTQDISRIREQLASV